MSDLTSGLAEFSILSVILRLALAMAAGGVLGYGRSRKNRAAGFRTYMLTSTGAALASLLGCFEYVMLKNGWNDVVSRVGMKYDGSRYAAAVIGGVGFIAAGTILSTAHQQVSGLSTAIGLFAAAGIGHFIYLNMNMTADLTRIGAAVISGLGFIGAGTIIVTKKGGIKGLTTAAGLWTTGIIGLAVGSGFYEGGIIATALVLFAETAMSSVGSRIGHLPEFSVAVSYSEKAALDDVLRFCKNHNIAIADLKIEGNDRPDSGVKYMADISLRSIRSIEPAAFSARLSAIPGIDDVKLSRDDI